MKYFFYPLLFILAACTNSKNKNSLQEPLILDSTWKKQSISEVLSVSLPDSIASFKKGILNASFANGKSGLYGVDYYDTVVVPILNESDFRNAIKGYMYGKLRDPGLSTYDLNIRDTIIAGTSGLFITGVSNDTLQSCTHSFCYLTMAQSKFYWFYACQSTSEINNETKQFFHSINFVLDKISEDGYEPERQKLHKKAD
jgi:hypothetical protein